MLGEWDCFTKSIAKNNRNDEKIYNPLSAFCSLVLKILDSLISHAEVRKFF